MENNSSEPADSEDVGLSQGNPITHQKNAAEESVPHVTVFEHEPGLFEEISENDDPSPQLLNQMVRGATQCNRRFSLKQPAPDKSLYDELCELTGRPSVQKRVSQVLGDEPLQAVFEKKRRYPDCAYPVFDDDIPSVPSTPPASFAAAEDSPDASPLRDSHSKPPKKTESGRPAPEKPTRKEWDEDLRVINDTIERRSTESMRAIETSSDISSVIDLLQPYKVKAAKIYNHLPYLRETRNEVLGSTMRDAILYHRERLENVKEMSPFEWYSHIARVYKGYGIPIRNVQAVVNEPDTRKFMRPDGQNLAHVVELAGGNSDIARQIARGQAWDAYVMRQFSQLGQISGQLSKRKLNDFVDFVYDSPLFDYVSRPGGLESMLSSVWAVDYVGKYAKYISKKGITGVTSDICLPPEKFFLNAYDNRREYAEKRKATNPSFNIDSFMAEEKILKPNSADLLIMNLALDRIRDFNAAIEIMKRLARVEEKEENGETKFVAPANPTKFFIGSIFPLSTNSDSETDDVPNVPFWDAVGSDPRIRMREEHCREDKDRPSYVSPRAWSIYRCITALADKGLVVDTIAEQPSYEVFSPHCLLDKAKILREKYGERLRAKTFFDDDLERLKINVLEGKVRDEALILFPQEYRMVFLGGKILRPEKL